MQINNINSRSVQKTSFQGIYKLTCPEKYNQILRFNIDTNPELRDKLSMIMYNSDFNKGELKKGDNLISCFFNYTNNLIIGITGKDVISFQEKLTKICENPPIELGTLLKCGKNFKKSVKSSYEESVQSFDELLKEKNLTINEIEEIFIPAE